MSLLSLSLLLAAGHAMAANIYTDDVHEQRKLFEAFKTEHERVYESADIEAEHFNNFLINLKNADALNAESAARGESAAFGITPLSDRNMTAFGTGFAAPTAPVESDVEMSVGHRKLPTCATSTTSSNVDWTNVLTTAVNNEVWCLGGHWAFAVAQQLESDAKRDFSTNYVLSAQQLLSCVTNNNGCSGVSASNTDVADYAFDYAKTQGLYLSSTYPFTSSFGMVGACQATTGNNEKVRVDASFSLLTNEEACMAHYVQNTGPLSVCMNMGTAIMSYTGGIMSASTCSSGSTHFTVCAQIVGVNLVTGTTPYWKLRGSFGTGFGEGGYFRLSYGANTCAITQKPIYSSVLVEGNF